MYSTERTLCTFNYIKKKRYGFRFLRIVNLIFFLNLHLDNNTETTQRQIK